MQRLFLLVPPVPLWVHAGLLPRLRNTTVQLIGLSELLCDGLVTFSERPLGQRLMEHPPSTRVRMIDGSIVVLTVAFNFRENTVAPLVLLLKAMKTMDFNTGLCFVSTVMSQAN